MREIDIQTELEAEDEPRCGFWSEASGAVAIMAIFLVVGLAGASIRAGAYPAPSMKGEVPDTPRVWLVDGFNLLHAAVLTGRDRAEWWRLPARTRVLELVDGLPGDEAEIWVVFDGTEPEGEAELPPRVRQVFAPSADDWLVRRVKEMPRGEAVAVVTADRQLADRARHHGAEVISPRDFANRCRQGEPAAG